MTPNLTPNHKHAYRTRVKSMALPEMYISMFCLCSGCLRHSDSQCVAFTPSLCSRCVTVLRRCAHGAPRCSFQAVVVLTVCRGAPTSSPAPSAQGGSRKLRQFKPSLCSRCVTVLLQGHPPHRHRLAHASSGKLVEA